MSGSRLFLDTNAIIAFLQGNDALHTAFSKADWIGTSVIAVIEFLSFQHLTEEDILLFKKFINRIHIEGLSKEWDDLQSIASLRSQHYLKTPDAIIVAQSKRLNAVLVTNDKKLQSVNALSF